MTVLWMILTAVSLLAAGIVYGRTRRLLGRLDQMLESAVDGEFTETAYTEDMLSRLEARLYRYLSLDRQERRETARSGMR